MRRFDSAPVSGEASVMVSPPPPLGWCTDSAMLPLVSKVRDGRGAFRSEAGATIRKKGTSLMRFCASVQRIFEESGVRRERSVDRTCASFSFGCASRIAESCSSILMSALDSDLNRPSGRK